MVPGRRDTEKMGKTEQQEPRVSFSVGTKLLISVVVILTTIIVFLNISAIFLLREDKRAYVYEAQSTAAGLAGTQFVTIVGHQLDTLRLSLASINPVKPVTPLQQSAFQAVVDNQNELLGVTLALVDGKTGSLRPLSRAIRAKELEAEKLTPQALELPAASVLHVVPELLQNSYAFLNISKPGEIPLLAVLVADLNLRSNPTGLPVAVGLAPLKAFASQLPNLALTIATRAGDVLFDTDPTVQYSRKSAGDDPLHKAAVGSALANGALEFDAVGNHYLGSYGNPGYGLIVSTRTEWKKALKATYALIQDFIILGTIAVGVAIIFAIFFSKTLTAPINRLYQATRQVAQGNFDLRLDIRSRDEIGALTTSFNTMSHQIRDLIKEQAEKITLQNELTIASTVQQTLIPPETFHHPKIQIRSHYQAAAQCGGDWWGFFGVGNKFAIMIADATGHGIPSALITASARSCFSVLNKIAQEDEDFSFSPSAMLSYANRVVYDASLGQIMMTFFVAVVDFDERTLTYSNAGHNPPWLYKRRSDGFKLMSLTLEGSRVGENRDTDTFLEKTVPLKSGDMLFLYTDGLMEGKDLTGRMYGKKRVREVVDGALPHGPSRVISDLMADFRKHNEGKPLDDDVTLAVCRLFPEQAGEVPDGPPA
jgi:sigma-B regulation protein RsbU (phosphoserine phosphatase)